MKALDLSIRKRVSHPYVIRMDSHKASSHRNFGHSLGNRRRRYCERDRRQSLHRPFGGGPNWDWCEALDIDWCRTYRGVPCRRDRRRMA